MAKKRKKKHLNDNKTISGIKSENSLVIVKQEEKNPKIDKPKVEQEAFISEKNESTISENTENEIKAEAVSSNINSPIKNNKKWYWKILDYIVEKQFASKLFIICFSTFLFSYIYLNQEQVTREALAYIGLILTMVVCYVELVGIRDHLWLLEGSLPYSKKWRDSFFSPKSLRRNKIKKIIILLFAFLVFTYIYRLKKLEPYRGALSFLGTILMVIAVYYESLAIRDELNIMNVCLKHLINEEFMDFMDRNQVQENDKDNSKDENN